MKNSSPFLILILLLVVCFILAVKIAPRAETWSDREKSNNVIGMLFGDGRRLFANQFFTMADVYFHSGYYPSIFDRAEKGSEIAAASQGQQEDEEEEKKEDFLGKPKDVIDAFGRNFRITEHTHLEHGNEREILPWLRLAADLDPQMIQTYTVGAYWLREHLHQTDEAENFLREGLRNNPDSYEILFELGRLYDEGYHHTDQARNVWNLALQKWAKLTPDEMKDNRVIFEEITVHLGELEKKAGNFNESIRWFEAAQKVSPAPGALQQRIDEVKRQQSAATSTNAPAH